MKAVDFEEANADIAKNQPQYKTLPSHIDEEVGTITACFELNGDEIKQVRRTKKIWLTMLTFNNPMHPIKLSCGNPFRDGSIPIEEEFKIYNKTTTRLGFKDRIKILFGAKIVNDLTITVDGEVEVKQTESSVRILPKKERKQTTLKQQISTKDF
jgi:hypothetical protein